MPPPPAPVSRAAYVRAILPHPSLHPTLYLLARSSPPLHAALLAFRRPYAGPKAVYDLVAYVHAFGVRGPPAHVWHAAFAAAAAIRLRPELLALLVAHALTGGDGDVDKPDIAERVAVLAAVVLGQDDVPGILDAVCDAMEDWIISPEALSDVLAECAEGEAERWDVRRVSRAGDVLWVRRGDPNYAHAPLQDDALGNGLASLARRVGVRVARTVAEERVRLVSPDGVQTALDRVRERAEVFVEVAAGRAMGVLVRKVVRCWGDAGEGEGAADITVAQGG